MMAPITPMVKHLIIINIIFFVGSNFVVPSDVAYRFFSLYFPLTDNFYFWQIFTHMFMHAKINEMITHIVFNMLGLYMFGSVLEHFWGGKRFLFFYISCGIGAALLHLGIDYYEIQQFLVNNDLNLSLEQLKILGGITNYTELNPDELKNILTEKGFAFSNENDINKYYTLLTLMNGSAVGASGALYGVMVAYAFMFPNAEMMLMFIPFPIKAKYFVPLLVLYDFISGIAGSSLLGGGGIAHFAHVGGALTGFIIMYMWRNKKFNFKRWN